MTAYYTIQILQGLTTDRSFLSCRPDGTVDLWNEDDGSGRQRWVLTEFGTQGHGEMTYLISVYAGVSSTDAIYLAWDANGHVGLQAPVYGPGGWGQWAVEPVSADNPPPSDFHIQPFWDRSRFLSCRWDGTLVDLWGKDDGSGRQRWQLQGPVYDGSPPRASPFG